MQKNIIPPRTGRPGNSSPERSVSLDVSSSGHAQRKIKCPACGHKRYVRYWDSKQQQYLPEQFGKCDREENCGYYLAPWEWLKENRPNNTTNRMQQQYKPQGKQVSMFKEPKAVDKALVAKTLAHYGANNLVAYLRTVIGDKLADKVCAEYFIGTGQQGATIFWQIDMQMRTRTGQRIIYDSTGHRDKQFEPKRLFTTAEGYEPCLFGEHLLYTRKGRPVVAIVESEKTAAIASVYLPRLNGQDVVWLAASGVYGLTEEKCLVLSGREIVLVPDFSFHARAIWGQVVMRKATNERGFRVPHPDGAVEPDFVPVSAKLQALGCIVKFFDASPDCWDGSDIADLLLRQPPKLLNEPDYNTLKLPSVAQQRTAARSSAENSAASLKYPSGEKEFKIAYNSEARPVVHCAAPEFEEYLTGFFNNEHVAALAAALSCSTGTIQHIPQTE